MASRCKFHSFLAATTSLCDAVECVVSILVYPGLIALINLQVDIKEKEEWKFQLTITT